MTSDRASRLKRSFQYLLKKVNVGKFDESDALALAHMAAEVYSEIIQHNNANPSNCSETCKHMPKSIYSELAPLELIEAIENTTAYRFLITEEA